MENSNQRPFKHPADRDKQIQKLENLTQKPNQSVRMFIEKINNTYNSIYDDTNNQNLSIKNDLLVKILLKGVLKPIKTLMVLNQLLPEVTTWEDAQKAAIRCETTLYKTQFSAKHIEMQRRDLPTSNPDRKKFMTVHMTRRASNYFRHGVEAETPI
jgi:hypothetical protein